MKRTALILGILGGVSGLGLWLMSSRLCGCALPPEYRKPIYPFDPSPLLNRPFGDIIVLGTPLVALVGVIVAVLAVLPRFQAQRMSQVEIICGFILLIFLGIIGIATQKPHDLAAFIPSLIGIVPGILVVASGFLSRRLSARQPA